MSPSPERLKLEERLLSQLNVLVIDDEASIVSLLRSILYNIGVGVVLPTSLLVVELFIENRALVNVVFCDWNMPGTSGLEILKALRAIDPDILFVMVTGTAETSLVLEARNSGVSAYIRKPFTAAAIRQKLLVLAKIIAHRTRFEAEQTTASATSSGAGSHTL